MVLVGWLLLQNQRGKMVLFLIMSTLLRNFTIVPAKKLTAADTFQNNSDT